MNLDLTILQGATWAYTFRWGRPTYSYAAITAITKAAPAVLSAASHGIPDGWYAAVVGAKGMTEINAQNDPPIDGDDRDFRKITVDDVDAVSINEVNSTNFGTYTGGGVLMWRTPASLSGFTARMHIRESLEASTTLLELTTDPAPGGGAGNGRIVLDNTAKTITATIEAADTEAIDWEDAVYDLEMVSAGGVVTRIAEGRVKVSKEVTR